MPPISVLIKPASGLCNMRCRYCFYSDEISRREVQSYGIMSPETSEALVRRIFEYATSDVSIAFQGGEPTLAGAQYFEHFTELVDRYNTNGLRVSYSIQTNGYEVSDELCAILKKHKFLAGVSLDGSSAVHDSLRRDAADDGTFKRVNGTIKKFTEYGIDFNILTVVTAAVCKNISKIYPYFKSRNFKFLQFIKYINGLGECGESFAPTEQQYTQFLCTAFGYYYDDFMEGRYISVREFDNFVMLAAGRDAECCGMNGACSRNLVIEADGSAYPCDFYVLDEWRLGNVHDTSIAELYETENAMRFIGRSRNVSDECRQCRFFLLCRGGCIRYRESAGTNALGEFSYCKSYYEFFDRNALRILDLSKYAKARRAF